MRTCLGLGVYQRSRCVAPASVRPSALKPARPLGLDRYRIGRSPLLSGGFSTVVRVGHAVDSPGIQHRRIRLLLIPSQAVSTAHSSTSEPQLHSTTTTGGKHHSASVSSASGSGQAAGLCLRFTVPEFLTHVGAELAVVGNLPQLGAWQAKGAQRLAWAPGHRWSADIALPAGWEGDIEYKVRVIPFCLPGGDGRATWSTRCASCLHGGADLVSVT